MSESLIKSIDIKEALKEIRPSFLDQKITIDDVSNDIKEVERELNSMGATDEFTFELSRAYVHEYARQIEDYTFNAPIVSRNLVWKKHGEKWRLFYVLMWEHWDVFTAGSIETCSEAETKIVQRIDQEEGMGLDILNEFEKPGIDLRPLIDSKTEIRLAVHPRLPEFLKAFAEDWKQTKYRRSAL